MEERGGKPKTIIGGDFNARTGEEERGVWVDKGCHGGEGREG